MGDAVRDGWVVRPLGQIGEILMGQSPPGSSYNTAGKGVPLINGPVEFGPTPFSKTTRTKFTTEPTKMCSAGDLILCVRGSTTGRMNIAGFDSCVGRGVAAIRAGENQDWVNLFVYANRDEIYRLGSGATFPNVSGATLSQIKVPLPPLPEQKRIVAILDEAFAGIDTAVANAEKNLANARELFESYLDSVFTERGEGWEERTLQEVSVEFARGKSKHRPRNDPQLYGGKYPFVQTGDVRNAGQVITAYSQTYSEQGLAQSKLWPKGTICITIAANIAETAILGFDACFPDSVVGIVVDPNVTSNEYVEYVLRFFKAVLKAKGKGSAQDNINLGTFETQRFPFPPHSTQMAVVERLNTLQASTNRLAASLESKKSALGELRQAILHKAFTGELTAKPEHAMREAAL